MIYPITLYNFGKSCKDSTVAGNVLRALCKQDVELSAAERTMLEMIKNDNDWMNERIESQRERWKERQKKARLSRDVTQCHSDNHDVTQCHRDISDVTHCHGDNGDNHDVTLPTYLPPFLPSSLPSSLPEYTNRSDTDTDKGVKGGIIEDMKSASGSDRIRLNVYGMDGEEFFSGRWKPLQLCNAALGKGFWAKAIRTLGDAAVLEELWAFVSEVRSGEAVENPGAVMTERLKAKMVSKQ